MAEEEEEELEREEAEDQVSRKKFNKLFKVLNVKLILYAERISIHSFPGAFRRRNARSNDCWGHPLPGDVERDAGYKTFRIAHRTYLTLYTQSDRYHLQEKS